MRLLPDSGLFRRKDYSPNRPARRSLLLILRRQSDRHRTAGTIPLALLISPAVRPVLSGLRAEPHHQMQMVIHDRKPTDGHREDQCELLDPIFDPSKIKWKVVIAQSIQLDPTIAKIGAIRGSDPAHNAGTAFFDIMNSSSLHIGTSGNASRELYLKMTRSSMTREARLLPALVTGPL
jgi:hypothetical protein